MTTVKITELSDIGANLASSTVIPVVNMAGTPITQKTNVGNIANIILEGAGVDYPEATVALLAQTVSNAAQPNITSVGTLTNIVVSGNATVNGNITSNGTAYVGNLSTTGLASITTLDVGTSANLGSIANVIITGGTIGQILSTDGEGNLSWTSDATTYGNSNVVTLLSAFGSNTITTTGNISGGNLVTGGEVVSTGNVSSGTGLSTGGFLSVDGATDLHDTTVTGNLSATGNITANNLGNISAINLTGSNSNVLYGNGVFAAVAGGANTGNVTFDDINVIGTGNLHLQPDPANAGAYLDIYLTAGPDIHISGGSGYSGAVILGTDEEANVAILPGGNVAIQAGNVSGTQTWNFGTDGTTTFPTANVDLHNGGVQSGEVLQFGNPNLQSIITGPTPSANVSAERLIIQGQRGNGTGEGGDVYVWGGDADTNGGDIKIYAGNADNVSAGTGGYVNIDGGDGFDQGGAVTIDGGISANGPGGQVSMTGGSGELNGGYASLQGGFSANGQGGVVQISGGGGNSQAAYGNVEIGSGTYTWLFDNTGNVRLPGNTFAVNYANGTQVSIGGGGLPLANGSSNFNIATSGGNVTIDVAGLETWTFDTNGNLTIPGSIVGTATVDIDNRASGNGADINLYSADDILIQARDRDIGSTSEGGDINIYAGDSAEDGESSGGDIVIEAGDGGAANLDFGGDGGFIRIEAGRGGNAVGANYSALSGGSLTLRAGDAGTNNGNIDLGDSGGDVYIEAGDSTGNGDPGGSIILTAGTAGANALAGQIQLIIPGGDVGAGGTWTFDGAGIIQLPNSGTISNDGNNIDIGSTSAISLEASSAVNIYTDTGTNAWQWQFQDDGNLRLPTIELDVGNTINEQTVIQSQRKIIPGLRYSAVIVGTTPTVVYTATSVDTTSMKVTMQIQHSGLGFEFFDVSATSTGGNTYYTVSNRVQPPTISNSTVVVDLNGSNFMDITVTINSGAANSWVTYDATEFGIAVD
jgi:filamentous hemagglutinin